ncbi:MAG: transposase [Patescibacteria group bacterium]
MTQRRIYQVEYPYFVTFRTREGFRVFEERARAALLVRIMRQTCRMKGYNLLGWQIMLDHVHILIHQLGTAPTAGCGGRNDNIPRAHPAVGARLHHAKRCAGTAARARRFSISDLLHGIKSYYCKELRTHHNITFPFFQLRFYTRIVTTDEYFRTIIRYLIFNPIKAELPKSYRRIPYQYVDWKMVNRLLV